ncbi:hypothetical protein [Streptomyces sp. NRRL B-1140]|nr:hypothetical protein [Streptomyces sp. NRRL B-1140]
MPHEDVDGGTDQGSVHVFRGGSGGLGGAFSLLVDRPAGAGRPLPG